MSILNNKWALEDELVDMDALSLKDLLIANLEKFYDSEMHSKLDLSLRPETGDKSGQLFTTTLKDLSCRYIVSKLYLRNIFSLSSR